MDSQICIKQVQPPSIRRIDPVVGDPVHNTFKSIPIEPVGGREVGLAESQLFLPRTLNYSTVHGRMEGVDTEGCDLPHLSSSRTILAGPQPAEQWWTAGIEGKVARCEKKIWTMDD